MRAYEYLVVQDIAEIGARVWDVLVWRWPDVFLYRKTAEGHILRKYPLHWTFLLLKYESHIEPRCTATPRPIDLARQVAGARPWPPPLAGRSHLRLEP